MQVHSNPLPRLCLWHLLSFSLIRVSPILNIVQGIPFTKFVQDIPLSFSLFKSFPFIKFVQHHPFLQFIQVISLYQGIHLPLICLRHLLSQSFHKSSYSLELNQGITLPSFSQVIPLHGVLFLFLNSSLFPNFVYDIPFPRVSLRHPPTLSLFRSSHFLDYYQGISLP